MSRNIKGEIRELLLNGDINNLMDLVQEVNGWNGELEYLELFENDEDFFTSYFPNSMEAVRATHYGNYRYANEYVKINDYGNVDSYSKYEAEELLREHVDDIIEAVCINYSDICIYDSELEELFQDLVYGEEEEEE